MRKFLIRDFDCREEYVFNGFKIKPLRFSFKNHIKKRYSSDCRATSILIVSDSFKGDVAYLIFCIENIMSFVEGGRVDIFEMKIKNLRCFSGKIKKGDSCIEYDSYNRGMRSSRRDFLNKTINTVFFGVNSGYERDSDKNIGKIKKALFMISGIFYERIKTIEYLLFRIFTVIDALSKIVCDDIAGEKMINISFEKRIMITLYHYRMIDGTSCKNDFEIKEIVEEIIRDKKYSERNKVDEYESVGEVVPYRKFVRKIVFYRNNLFHEMCIDYKEDDFMFFLGRLIMLSRMIVLRSVGFYSENIAWDKWICRHGIFK